jgi:hypothetical protein
VEAKKNVPDELLVLIWVPEEVEGTTSLPDEPLLLV